MSITVFGRIHHFILMWAFAFLIFSFPSTAHAQMECAPIHEKLNEAEIAAGLGDKRFGRTVCADVVAIDQMLVYNRFGAFNPFGMMYALRRDVVPLDEMPKAITADACDDLLGTETSAAALSAGDVRLKDCKRPRPMVLRANVGDVLHVRMTNLLAPDQPNFSSDFCGSGKDIAPGVRGDHFPRIRTWMSEGDQTALDHGEATCAERASTDPDGDNNWPAERGMNFAIQGLTAFAIDGDGKVVEAPRYCKGLSSIAPDDTKDCYYMIEREGPFFLASTAAPSGGEGDGGSITHGLFGAVMAQNTDARAYRSQTTHGAFNAVWKQTDTPRHALSDVGDLGAYETTDRQGVPILNVWRDNGDSTVEVVHADLNAIVHQPAKDETPSHSFREFSVFFHDELKTFVNRNFEELGDYGQLAGVRDGFAINYGAGGMGSMLLANRKGIGPAANCVECLYEEFFLTSWANGDPALLEQYSDDPSNVHHSYLNDAVVFRNFHAGPKETHVFHLHAHQWFAGNDEGRGSYLDSQTVGPQQGFSYNIYDGGLEVYHPSGAPDSPGWYETLGSGNRNRTPGDSIFHCHLYPHFAQGMWELWRVHDVLEDGTRKLPDGQWQPDFSLAEMDLETRAKKRPGSVDPATGRWIDRVDQQDRDQLGTPVPAIIPLPDQPWPLLPSYAGDDLILTDGGKVTEADESEVIASDEPITTFPGYPYYIGGQPGHRPPQAPMDIARELAGDFVTDAYLDGGLPRHVVTDNASRKFPFSVPKLDELSNVSTLADALANPGQIAREATQAQIVAKALAMGDMTMKFVTAELDLLPYDGTPIERTGMAFHEDGVVDGSVMTLFDALGAPTGLSSDGRTYRSVSAGGGGVFGVNGAPAKPGAPFADPCGGPDDLGAEPGLSIPILMEQDPFVDGLAGTIFGPDPAVSGYRRYEGSAVQLDLVTNRAGWHDPQARINVLTANSDGYKAGPDGLAATGGKYSPRISASEEPFFFRALSGECIEFRHTNELPKDLELDDFQIRTPTDTIGQHIHLVKFDVTASDGSGNGWNYEDGTFAADEIAARICAAKNVQNANIVTGVRAAGELKMREVPGLCELKAQDDGSDLWVVSEKYKDIWRRTLSDNRDLFQTTTQRWFADPILSSTRADGSENGEDFDRTMRTVFSHDHFGPSSIQQHGFYTALVIEPAEAEICNTAKTACAPQRTTRDMVTASDIHVGARKIIIDHMPLDPATPEYREFALSIADFATLYDPRAATKPGQMIATFDESETEASEFAKGMATLVCEAQHAVSGDVKSMQRICSSDVAEQSDGAWAAGGDVPPAWTAAGRPGDTHHVTDNLLEAGEILASAALNDPNAKHDDLTLTDHVVRYRRMAAGFDAHDPDARLAAPVSPPHRPESISVDHHDPYLMNYRGEPLPLRIGTNSSGSSDCDLKPLPHWVASLQTGVTEDCEVSTQRNDGRGDMANVFLTGSTASGTDQMHGDPVTPILETYDNDPVQIRLIQGAQEVQHTFTLEGYTWERNIDQRFPAILPRMDDVTRRGALADACRLDPVLAGAVSLAQDGRPEQYRRWMIYGPSGFSGADQDYWSAFETQIAQCFNVEGRVAAQEIGISEHFEFRASYLFNSNFEGTGSSTVAKKLAFYRSLANTDPENWIIMDQLDRKREELLLAKRRTTPSDTLVHFGSTDALWNGAWGLLRVRSAGASKVPLGFGDRLLDSVNRIDDALLQLRTNEIRGDEARQFADPLLREAEALLDQQALLQPDAPVRPRLPDLDLRAPDGRLQDLLRNNLDGLRVPDLQMPESRSPGLRLPENRLPQIDIPGLDLPDRRGFLTPDIRQGGGIGRIVPAQFTEPPAPLDRMLDFRNRFDGLIVKPEPTGKALEPELIAKCDPTAQRVYAAVVAIEAETVFGSGTLYSERLSDPDGLFFAIVDPRRVLSLAHPAEFPTVNDVNPVDIDNVGSWNAIPLKDVITAVQDAYDRPEPMVMNVNAGDCVRVTWINALRREKGSSGLKDAPGDALMPKITSLNVDVRWSPEEEADDTPNENANLTSELDVDDDIEPSNRLAVNFPLPVMNKQLSYARPVGRNPIWALDGADTGRVSTVTLSNLDLEPPDNRERSAEIMQMEFYAGRAFGNWRRSPVWSLINPGTALQVAAGPVVADRFEVASIRRYIPAEIEELAVSDLVKQNPALAGVNEEARRLDAENPRLARLFRDRVGLVSPDRTLGQDLDDVERLAVRYAGQRREFAALIDELISGTELLDLRPQEELDILGMDPLRLDPDTRKELGLDQVAIGRTSFRGISYGESVLLPADIAKNLGLAGDDPRGDDRGVQVSLESLAAAAVRSDPDVARRLIAITLKLDDLTRQYSSRLDAILFRPGLVWLIEWLDVFDVRFVPYAFGALPVKSQGDVIGHPLEGLIGAITVVPEDAVIKDVRAPKRRFGGQRFGCFRLDLLDPGQQSNKLPVPKRFLRPTNDRACTDTVIVPDGDRPDRPFWTAQLTTPGPDDEKHVIRQFTLFWQDGLNLTDRETQDETLVGGSNIRLVATCGICGDSYDWGEKGVSYRSEPFNVRLGDTGQGNVESHFNLNAFEFGEEFFPLKPTELTVPSGQPMPVLRAIAGEEVVVHVVHPGGRARQRAFATIAQDYDDMFRGFGFPRAALLAPGKAITASLTKAVKPGCYLWFDGPTHTRSGGSWGLLDVVAKDQFENPRVSACARAEER
ncbi:hypothetical protein SAMN05421666_1271 [Roseovarius nanhaiticus]|uniref:Multicopper oxidase n=1 Tax=Roseovarius nanhaiticus TaxID=573024 RepID=A0A1N7FQH1_9RHOB|nr:hypothetical protein SAMN05216208_0865 [Roseovarius nanhaiticus]SIS02571.1 hypothetical protein SAMN05421666_1271 [Roseovarius nanhaiticus]